MVIRDRAWHKTEVRKNQRRMAKNALRSADPRALKNVKKRLRKGTKDTPRFTPKEIQAMRGELRKETPLQRSQKMAAGKGPVRETATGRTGVGDERWGDVWTQRWAAGPLKKTFGTRAGSRYGSGTRPVQWREMTNVGYGENTRFRQGATQRYDGNNPIPGQWIEPDWRKEAEGFRRRIRGRRWWDWRAQKWRSG